MMVLGCREHPFPGFPTCAFRRSGAGFSVSINLREKGLVICPGHLLNSLREYCLRLPFLPIFLLPLFWFSLTPSSHQLCTLPPCSGLILRLEILTRQPPAFKCQTLARVKGTLSLSFFFMLVVMSKNHSMTSWCCSAGLHPHPFLAPGIHYGENANAHQTAFSIQDT